MKKKILIHLNIYMVVCQDIADTKQRTITRRRLQYKCLLICLSFDISNKLQIWSKWKVQTHQTNRNQHSYSWLCTGISSCGKWWMKWYTLLFTHKKTQSKQREKKREILRHLNIYTRSTFYKLGWLIDWITHTSCKER